MNSSSTYEGSGNNTDLIRVHGRLFKPYISKAQIDSRIAELAAQISIDYSGLRPLFVAILNGSFIFAADLFRALSIEAEISFIKLASYKGTSSTGQVVTAIGLEERLNERHVIVLEDIIDTGKTLHAFLPEIRQRNPSSLKIASFLLKPSCLKYDVHADYFGFEVPDQFVLGYGLDYDGLGRNLPELYTLVAE
ncbi:MAG: hypoxanthine phosphoribosyltransferase [Bacteroidetes bacterium]|nr:hypoxanthine phosphoribosyltransferase [Bacteroidota bacterium]MBS1629304.1 hypoxanthine phosphoribosyltransferase [Bacteroidota bacterium]